MFPNEQLADPFIQLLHTERLSRKLSGLYLISPSKPSHHSCTDFSHGKLVGRRGAALFTNDKSSQGWYGRSSWNRTSKARSPVRRYIARQFGVYGTVCVNARSAELFPETVRHIVSSGFELAGHNYAQNEVLSGLSEKEERVLIEKSLRILTEIGGVAPVGWLSSTIATTEITADLLAEAGLLWHGDYNYIDLPVQIDTAKGNIVAIPHSDYADNRVLRGAPDDWFNCYRDMFDYLHQNEPGSFINITMHGNFGGRPLMAAQLEKLLRYMAGHEGVWVPRHDELANWVNEQGLRERAYTDRFKIT